MSFSIMDAAKGTNLKVTLKLDKPEGGVDFFFEAPLSTKTIEVYDLVTTKLKTKGIKVDTTLPKEEAEAKYQEDIMANFMAIEMGVVPAKDCREVIQSLPGFDFEKIQTLDNVVNNYATVNPEIDKNDTVDNIYKYFFKVLTETIKESKSDVTPSN